MAAKAWLMVTTGLLAVLCAGCRKSIPSITGDAATPAVDAQKRSTPPDHFVIIFGDANPDSGPAPLTVQFSADTPYIINGPKYNWDFGDGSPPSHEQSPTHVYKKAGHYTASLKVVDATGMDDDDTVDVTVE